MFLDTVRKIRDAALSALPVLVVVVVLYILEKSGLGLTNLGDMSFFLFLISVVIMIFGMYLFTMGADTAMSKMGEYVGASITKKQSVGFLIVILFLFGVFVTVAEPDLGVFAAQVYPDGNQLLIKWLLIISVSVGVGSMLVIGAVRILMQKNLKLWLIAFYGLLFAIACIIDYAKIPMSFDSGGVTTGPITVPFILALGVGIATSRGGKSNSDSFGLVAFCSVGPIITVMIFSLVFKTDSEYVFGGNPVIDDLFSPLLHSFLNSLKDVTLSLVPIIIFFLIYNFLFLKLSKNVLAKIGFGVLFTFLGLVLFLTAVEAGFMPIGTKLGMDLQTNQGLLIGIGAVLGVAAVFAEPAVAVLTSQIESVSDGAVSKTAVVIALAVGNGLAIALSLLRMVTGFSLLYVLVPGYILAFFLTFLVPDIYSAIAFDSGGVVSGPMNSTFILPFAIGACYMFYGETTEKIMTHSFGTIALVALMPLISIQMLGLTATIRSGFRFYVARRRVKTEHDNQIIHF